MTADVPRFATYLNAPDEGFGNRLARVLFELATYVRGNNAEWQKALWSAGESLAVLEASRDCYLRTHGPAHALIAEALQHITVAPCEIRVFTTHRPNHHSGRGDVLNLVRVLPTLATLYPGLKVSLRTEPEFAGLFADSFPRVAVTAIRHPAETRGGTSLEQVFAALSEESFAWPTPYLHTRPELVARYRAIVPPGSIGLCWAASGGRCDPRSVPLIDMQSLWLQHPCVSLQVGHERRQSEATRVLDVLPESPDWAETAALIAALRCVVSVDTAVAHLAGATGALVHLLVQRPNPVFYGEEPCPFYPSMTVHLKGDAGWSEAVGRVAAALAA